MALPSILRFVLLCLLERALLAPGFSLRSFLSRQSPSGIPNDERATTVYNIESGAGVVRPTTTTTAAPTTSTVSTWQSMNTPLTAATPTAVTAAAATPFGVITPATTNIAATATSVTVSTSLSAPVAAGATALPVASASGFTLGTTVVIDAGTSVEETNVISGFGSLLLQTPLKYAHAGGVTISTATPAAAASTVTATSAAATMAAGAASTPAKAPVPKDWKLQASVVMETNAPIFVNEYDASPTGFALTLAERMNLVTGVPMSRFAFYLPNPTPKDAATNVLFCQSNASGAASAFDRATNLSYTCEAQHKEFNTSLAPANGTNATNATTFLQLSKHVKHRRGFALLQDDDDDDAPLQMEVGIFPPTLVLTDVNSADQVASDIVRYSSSGDEAERKFLPTGFWTYKPGAGIKFHGLFPGTVAAMPGTAFVTRENSLPLGPNPGGHGATMPPPKLLKGMRRKVVKKHNSAEEYFKEVDEVVNTANTINRKTKASLKELAESLARASAAHSAWLNMYPYQLPEKYGGDPQPQTAMQSGMDMMAR